MNNSDFRSGYVAIIGRPNVGKSTLMNRLIGQKIAITSNRPQTTRDRIQTVYTDKRGQIIFLDTPGMNKPYNRLGEYMLSCGLTTIKDADVILWIVEPADHIGRDEQFILEELKKVNVPVILVMNKTDLQKKDDIGAFIEFYKQQYSFAKILTVSAKTGAGAESLLSHIMEQLPCGPMYYDEDTLTDQPVKQIASEIIREKILRSLNDEVPHGVAVNIDRYKERTRPDGIQIADIDASIICEKESHKGILIGRGGTMLKKIGTDARIDIEGLVGTKVNLKLWVKVRRNWRDSDAQLKNMGFDIKKTN